jgi:putative two-component system response regulator
MLARELAARGPYVERIDAAFLANLYRAAPLHDVGKVGIHDAVLLKPGRLTPEEMEHIKQHVVVGARTLESARDLSGGAFLTMAAEIARYHHEWFDGRGYCAGLCGEEIPLSARIVALADCYDAITSRRHYKPPHDPDAAREMILGESGTHFDPAVVEAFLACFDAFVAAGAAAAEDPAQSLLTEISA